LPIPAQARDTAQPPPGAGTENVAAERVEPIGGRKGIGPVCPATDYVGASEARAAVPVAVARSNTQEKVR